MKPFEFTRAVSDMLRNIDATLVDAAGNVNSPAGWFYDRYIYPISGTAKFPSNVMSTDQFVESLSTLSEEDNGKTVPLSCYNVGFRAPTSSTIKFDFGSYSVGVTRPPIDDFLQFDDWEEVFRAIRACHATLAMAASNLLLDTFKYYLDANMRILKASTNRAIGSEFSSKYSSTSLATSVLALEAFENNAWDDSNACFSGYLRALTSASALTDFEDESAAIINFVATNKPSLGEIPPAKYYPEVEVLARGLGISKKGRPTKVSTAPGALIRLVPSVFAELAMRDANPYVADNSQTIIINSSEQLINEMEDERDQANKVASDLQALNEQYKTRIAELTETLNSLPPVTGGSGNSGDGHDGNGSNQLPPGAGGSEGSSNGDDDDDIIDLPDDENELAAYIASLNHQISGLERDLELSESKLSIAQSDLVISQDQVQMLSDWREAKQGELDNLDSLNSTISSLTEEKENLTNELASLRGSLTEGMDNADIVAAELEALETRVTELNDRLSATQLEVYSLTNERDLLQEKVYDLEDALDGAGEGTTEDTNDSHNGDDVVTSPSTDDDSTNSSGSGMKTLVGFASGFILGKVTGDSNNESEIQ